eukprot:scaffold81358_cov60-Phaeocystis_antarctica.AAC.1
MILCHAHQHAHQHAGAARQLPARDVAANARGHPALTPATSAHTARRCTALSAHLSRATSCDAARSYALPWASSSAARHHKKPTPFSGRFGPGNLDASRRGMGRALLPAPGRRYIAPPSIAQAADDPSGRPRLLTAR